MDISAVEDDIVSRLTTAIANAAIDIRSWPDNPQDYQLLKPGGALLVRYSGSTYEPPEPNRQPKIVQPRAVEWLIAIVQKSLKPFKAHQGVYTLIDSVRVALTGYTITGLSDASVMHPTGDGFLSEAAGTWIYNAFYTFSIPEAEA